MNVKLQSIPVSDDVRRPSLSYQTFCAVQSDILNIGERN